MRGVDTDIISTLGSCFKVVSYFSNIVPECVLLWCSCLVYISSSSKPSCTDPINTWCVTCVCNCAVVSQMRDTAPWGWATSLKACRGSTYAEPATPPAPTAAPLTWRLSPVSTQYLYRATPRVFLTHTHTHLWLPLGVNPDLWCAPQLLMQAWLQQLRWGR